MFQTRSHEDFTSKSYYNKNIKYQWYVAYVILCVVFKNRRSQGCKYAIMWYSFAIIIAN